MLIVAIHMEHLHFLFIQLKIVVDTNAIQLLQQCCCQDDGSLLAIAATKVGLLIQKLCVIENVHDMR